MTSKKAFTLAEVLITLGIIGVVAALTIPALMQSTNNKELVSGTLKMNTTLSNALKNMEALDMVGVNKIADLETFDAKFRQQFKTVNCTDHSVCLADGGYFDYGAPQFGGACDRTTPCLIINADVNGKKGPNKDGKDRYTFQVTSNGILPLGLTETCSGLDCTAYVLANHKLWEGETTNSTPANVDPTVANCSNASEESCTQCNSGYYVDTTNGQCKQAEGKVTLTVNGETKDYYLSDVTSADSYSPSGKVPGTHNDDYWQGANDVCTNKGMRLPSIDELQQIYTQKGQTGVPTSGFYWSSSIDDDDERRAYFMLFYKKGQVDVARRDDDANLDVLCVGN